MLLAFDLYGTLLSTASISSEIAAHSGAEKSNAIAALWRRYQIEYTFRLNSMKQYQSFEKVTEQSLIHALAEYGISIKVEAVKQIMLGYDQLATFDDVLPALRQLEQIKGVKCAVFSNGTRRMIDNSMKGSQLSQVGNAFSQLISVDHLQSFKPAPEVYKYLAHCTGMAGKESEIWLVSGNPFDIVGARVTGINAIWVDRAGAGWQDRLGPEPTKIIRRLEELVTMVSQP